MSDKTLQSGSTVIARNNDLLTAEVDGELVAMSVEEGNCYGLNAVGARIWTLLAEPQSIDSLCAQLMSEYDVDEATCRSEVTALLGDMLEQRMLSVSAA